MSRSITQSSSFINFYYSFFVVFYIAFSIHANAQEHPNLILTKSGVETIKKQLGTIPIFDTTLNKVKNAIDQEIASGIHVPIPKDMAGGYTHDRHKKNWITLQQAGVLYQLLADDKYAKYVHDVLKEYAKIYPTLPLHPQTRSYARGKIFWQCLNDSNWLVYVSQAYDCIYDYLSKKERDNLEKNLFIPYANFLSEGSPQFFNRIHNHSTWGNVAVGMIGLVMDNQELIDRALYGLKSDNIDPNQKDNDGGFIKTKGQKTGFLANLDEPFSPDGYYTEGPYYQRYAMYPFMIFAEALQNKKPELKIFEYKNGVLIKAVYALLNLTNANGEFFPLNDGQKGMSYYSRELVSAVNIAYHFGGNDPSLLSIAKQQNKIQLDDTGLSVALGIQQKKAKPFIKKSIELRDGSDGTQGSVGILRSKNQQFGLVMKYTAQGLSHGHYDKLSFSYYNKGNEILQDYGLARFVNIEQKNGGGYLKENKTWAKQSIAHNTIIQDEISHFEGKFKIGSTHHSEKYLFDVSNLKLQIVSAKEDNAYPGTNLHRTMLVLEDNDFENPLVIDVMQFKSKTTHQFDLPFYYNGQIIDTNFEYSSPETLTKVGEKNGYQHLWLEGKSILKEERTLQTTWKANQTFYTLSTLAKQNDEFLFTRIGANDPNFNLRRDPSFLIRKPKQEEGVFISVVEAHGSYNYVTEIANNAHSNIKKITKNSTKNKNYVSWSILTKEDKKHTFVLCTTDSNNKTSHTITINGKPFSWVGPYTHNKEN
ncbi:heparinase [Aquimarina sp. AD10]|uniref:heparinase II/III domain-containing protein n=1 Tax=Aquimarina sp. AD10 TaxID=1714849 RepID=UPI000E53D40C|nr:heparinase II/III family protein [Aquimarina sp. AD10]AXT58886.1 heparinase [Aquimarina sp. AD10]RKM99638.1 heparinase [Aquimarina sp. AD10]